MAIDIAHVTSVHSWNDTRIYLKMCRSLQRNGLNTHLVVLDPNADEVQVADREGVTVHLIPGSDITNRLKRASKGAHRVMRYAHRLKPKVIQVHDPELIPFLALSRLKGIRTIFDAHEDFVAQTDGRDWAMGWKKVPVSLLAHTLKFLVERIAYHIIAATPAITASYSSSKTNNINNYPIIGELAPPEDAVSLSKRPNRGIYVGGMADIRGLREVVLAASLSESIEAIDLVGPTSDPQWEGELRQIADPKKVIFHGVKSRDEVAQLLANARFGIVTFQPLPNHTDSQPNKLFEYLSAGLPVLHSNFKLWESITGPDEVGVSVDPLDPKSVAGGMDKILAQPDPDDVSRRARSLIVNKYSWDNEQRTYVTLIRLCAGLDQP